MVSKINHEIPWRTGFYAIVLLVFSCSWGFSANDENADWKKCREEFRGNNVLEAYKLVETLLEKFPNNRDYLTMKGKCLVKMRQVEESLAFFESLSKQFPEDPIIKAEWAVALAWASRTEEAMKLLESVDTPSMANHFRFLRCKGVVLAAAEARFSEKFMNFLSENLKKAYTQKPSEEVRDFLYFGAQMFYQIKFLDSTMAILNKIMADYPNCAREYRAYAVVYFTINPSRVPDFLQVAEQCPDSRIYQASIYTTKALYDFFVDENPDATLEDIAKLEEIGKLNIEMQYLRFHILMKREGMTVEQLEKYLPTCEPKNEKEEWLIFSIRLNFLRFQEKWQEVLDLLQSHSKFRITQEKTYLRYLLYAKYMQENSNPPSDEKVFFTKYDDDPIPSFIPKL